MRAHTCRDCAGIRDRVRTREGARYRMGFLQTIGQIGGVILLYFVMLTGVVIIPLGVPGEFLIVAATLVFILVAGSQVISWWVLVGILVLAIVAEILEAVAKDDILGQ